VCGGRPYPRPQDASRARDGGVVALSRQQPCITAQTPARGAGGRGGGGKEGKQGSEIGFWGNKRITSEILRNPGSRGTFGGGQFFFEFCFNPPGVRKVLTPALNPKP
jgi:hypothetical protein